MASKKYGYFIKGNKLALIQKNNNEAYCSLSGYENKTDCEAAGGTWHSSGSYSGDSSEYGKYQSPHQSVAKGLEIEYTYAPTYRVESIGDEEVDQHRFIGWGSNGTNLILFTYEVSTEKNLSSLFAADSWISISGSSRWSGLHQVKIAGGSDGILTLKTKCNLKSSLISNETFDFAAAGDTITADDNTVGQIVNLFKENTSHRDPLYVFIQGSDDQANNGFFKVSSIGGASNNIITVESKFNLPLATGVVTESASAIQDSPNDTGIYIYQAFQENLIVHEGVTVMQDESFELDVTHQQALAICYYLKAKMVEDIGEMEQREYYMRLFRKTLEKEASGKKYGPHIVQGHWNLR